MADTDTPPDAGAAARALGVYGKPMVDDTVRLMRQSQAEKEAKTAPIYERMERDYARDREAVDAARDRYKPVEEIKPPAPPVNDPLQAFGSAASMFAMIASAFTHTPAVNAMNGMAAAINGKRKGDLEAYELGYKQWKDNTELAIQNHKLQAEDMRLAMEAMRDNIALGTAMAKAVAAKTDDRVAMRLLEQGQYENLDELTRARETHAQAMSERKAKIEAHELLGRKESYGPDGKLTEEAHRKLMAGDPELAIRMQVAEQGKPGQPFNVKLPDGKTGLAVSVGGQIVDAFTRMPLPAGTVRAGAEKEMSGKEASIRAIMDANKGMTHDEAQIEFEKREARAKNEGAAIDDNAANVMAERFVNGDPGALQGLSARNPASISKVYDAVGKKLEAAGKTPSDVMRARARFMGETSAQRALGTRQAGLEAAVAEAEKFAPMVLEASEKIDRTEYPSVNAVMEAAMKGTGSEDMVRFAIAVNDFTNVFAQVVTRGAVTTEGARQQVQGVLQAAWSKGQVKSAVDQLMRAMRLAEASPGVARDRLERMYRAAGLDAVADAMGGAEGGRTAPAVGEIRKGHRFKGGNPADASNWEEVR